MNTPAPASWAAARLGDIATKIVDGSHNPPPKAESGGLMLSARNIANGRLDLDADYRLISADDFEREHRRTQLRAGDVLLTIVGTIGRSLVVEESFPPATLQRSVAAIRTCASSPKFLSYQLQSPKLQAYLVSVARGTAQKGVYLKTLADTHVVLAPLPEQQRIVEAIESYLTRLDNAVALLERVEENLKRYRASVLKAAVEGRLVPTEAELARREGRGYEPASELLQRILAERKARWVEDVAEKARAKAEEKARKAGHAWSVKDNAETLEKECAKAAKQYKEAAALETTDLPKLPEGWCWSTVEQLGEVVSGQTPADVAGALVSAGDIPWFRVGDMNIPGNEQVLRGATTWLSSADVAALGLHVRPAGTIVFPKRGGAIATNKKRRLARPSAYDLNTMGVVPVPEIADYLWMWFQQLDLAKLSDGSNVPQINHGDVAPLLVPVPPAAEQSRLLSEAERCLSVHDSVGLGIGSALALANRLRQSILKWAFEGKLVEQDPSDEPATVLLERIKAERSATGAETPRTRKRRSAE